MAAITVLSSEPTGQLGQPFLIRTGTAQATTGQTDWVDVPAQAQFASVYYNLTSIGASTTPTSLLSIFAADPIARNDSYKVKIAEHAALTAFTAANLLVVDIGPGVTGIANDVTNSATAVSYVTLNAVLPSLMGFTLLHDRGDADEVYTYTLSVVFR